jgi:hypothetical protein
VLKVLAPRAENPDEMQRSPRNFDGKAIASRSADQLLDHVGLVRPLVVRQHLTPVDMLRPENRDIHRG